MKRYILSLLAACAAFTSLAQTMTVSMRPHGNGKESLLVMDDSTCSSAGRIDRADSISAELLAGAWTGSGCNLFVRSLIRFDGISNHAAIPSGSTITSATLYLFGEPSSPGGNYGNSTFPGSPYTGSGANFGHIYELAAPFNPTTTCWRNQPTMLHTDSVAILPSISQWSDNDTFDVTNMVRHLYTSGNYGFLIKIDTEVKYRMRIFATSKATDTNIHPILKVTFVAHVGVNEVASAASLNITPNPASSMVKVQINVVGSHSGAISIFDILGRKVHSEDISLTAGDNIVNIPLCNFANGAYIMELRDEGGTVVQRFIKN